VRVPQTLRLVAATAAVAATALVTAGAAWATITLAPASQTKTTGQMATVTATALNPSGGPFGGTVTFTIMSGPNAGKTANVQANPNNGMASYSYTSAATGTDHIVASFNNSVSESSNDATVTWSAPVAPKTDVSVSITAPTLSRVGQNATWTATLSNAGPDPATGVVFKASTTPGATFVSATESRGNGCSGSTCAVGTLAAGATATVTLVYTLTQAGAVGVTATVESDFDTNTSNNTSSGSTNALQPGQPPPPPPPPAAPGTFNAIPTGTVLVNGGQRPADQQFVLNSGDTVDVTDGVMTFTAADGSTGNFSSSQPTSRRSTSSTKANLPAQFTVTQASAGGVTTLTLTGADFGACNTPRATSAVSKKPIRQLWGSAKGNFKTTGRYAAATVRGTIWLVQDRCDGTLTQVVDGVVSVEDLARKRTVTVNAGSSYLAVPVAPLKLPAQSPALVKKRGLLYAGKIYKTKKAFTTYLVANGHTWAEFAKKFPKVAAALAQRRH
jgi:uncharacterized repeat protein (TIGR01451 family)